MKRERLCRLLRLFRPSLPVDRPVCVGAGAPVQMGAGGLRRVLPGLCDRPLSGDRLVHLPPRGGQTPPGRHVRLLQRWGGATFRRRMNAATGAGVCLLILFMAAAIVAWAGRGVRSVEAAQGRAHEIDKE